MDRRLVFASCALATLLGSCAGGSNGSSGVAQVGEEAPAFTDPLASGGTLSMAQLRGKPVLLDFFATWCPPCNAEAPEIENAYRRFAPRGLQIVGVDVLETKQKTSSFVTAHGLTYPAVVDSGTLADAYRINGMPVSVFIDKTGIVRKIEIGELSQEQIDRDIAAVL
jgi:cytochrome c biogenesis protein CcmG/thiol:disulfide interchange protein DsbE